MTECLHLQWSRFAELFPHINTRRINFLPWANVVLNFGPKQLLIQTGVGIRSSVLQGVWFRGSV